MTKKTLYDVLYHINKILDNVGILEHEEIDIEMIASDVLLDLKSFLENDPAAGKNYKLVLESYQGFRAVMAYRIANYIHYHFEDNFFRVKARKISENIKSQTGIEIHPAAQINVPFILDHGYGTVIGETAVIGKNCYVLQGVIIGSKGISANRKEKRHPTLGSNIEVGAFCRLLGDIEIGDNVFIPPHNTITKSIPNNTKVIKK